MKIHFAELIPKKQNIKYIEDVIIQANTKKHNWKSLNFYFQFLIPLRLNAATNKTANFSTNYKFLGHFVSDKRIQPVAENVQDLKLLKKENRRGLRRVLGSLSFYSIIKLK